MNFIVLRRASQDTWELVGPTTPSMAREQAVLAAQLNARKHPEQVYAIAELKETFSIEKQVISQPINVNAGKVTRLREIQT